MNADQNYERGNDVLYQALFERCDPVATATGSVFVDPPDLICR
jgi:hypothetical protein